MSSLLRNEEFRSIIIKLIILQLVFALMGFALINLLTNNIKNEIINRDMALVGNIIKDHPQLEKEIIPYITKEIPDENQKIGIDVLNQYGYNTELVRNSQPILKNLSPNIQILTVILIIISIIPLIILIIGEYKKIYSKINRVSAAAERVVEGDFSIHLNEEGEGDFHILNHQFNQMANRLENSIDNLNKEKIFLKDTISDISHQLKTPLASLIILNDILMEDDNIDEADRIKFLEKVNDQLNRMEWLIINLLKVARLEAGAIEFKDEKVLFTDVLDIVLNTLGPSLENQEINIDGNRESFFHGDRDWTGEAIINIIKNAVEHGKGKIDIRLEDTSLFSTIRIRDNGDGINKKHLPNIFNRFYKITHETKPESIGIGLNLAKIIVESQEGIISVNSDQGEGTEFVITFLKMR